MYSHHACLHTKTRADTERNSGSECSWKIYKRSAINASPLCASLPISNKWIWILSREGTGVEYGSRDAWPIDVGERIVDANRINGPTSHSLFSLSLSCFLLDLPLGHARQRRCIIPRGRLVIFYHLPREREAPVDFQGSTRRGYNTRDKREGKSAANETNDQGIAAPNNPEIVSLIIIIRAGGLSCSRALPHSRRKSRIQCRLQKSDLSADASLYERLLRDSTLGYTFIWI